MGGRRENGEKERQGRGENKRRKEIAMILGEKARRNGNFPGGPVAKTWCSQSRGPRFNPW